MSLQGYIEQYRGLLFSLLTSESVDVIKYEQKIYQTIEKIEKEYGEEGIAQLAKLFYVKENDLGTYSARCLLSCIHPSKSVTARALSIIEQYSVSTAANADSFKEWLNAYHANHINEETYRYRKRVFRKYSGIYATLTLVLIVLGIFVCTRYNQLNSMFTMYILYYLTNVVYFHLLERKVNKGIENKATLAGLITLGALMLSAIIMWLFAHINLVKIHGLSICSVLIQYTVYITISISVAQRLWLRNSWASRKLPPFQAD